MNATGAELKLARRTLAAEGRAISDLAERVGTEFAAAIEMVFRCDGKVVLTGIGKAGIIARKISGTLASTGTQSVFLHPVEALHGDLGRLQRGDVVIALSHSGATEEIIRLLDHLKARGAGLIAVTGSGDSVLARHADITVCYGNVAEACPHGLAPTVSTACMLAIGDALALSVMEKRNFQPEDFAAFHPGGSLGRKLLKVEQIMTFRRDERPIVAADNLTLGEALAEVANDRRRSGAMLVADESGRLSGILTDADLRRHLTRAGEGDLLSRPVREFVTSDPLHVHLGDLVSEALAIFNKYRIDELPVLDEADRPVGIIDVQDVLGIKTVDDGAD